LKKIQNKIIKFFGNFDVHSAEVVKKTFSSAIVKILGYIFGLGISIFLGRTIGADGLGIINLSNRIISVVTIICLLGLQQTIVKEVAIAKSKSNWQQVKNVIFSSFWLSSSLSIIITSLLIFTAPWVSRTLFNEPLLTVPFIIASIVMTPQIISRIFAAGLNGFGKIWQSNLVDQTLSSAVSALILIILWLSNYKIDVTIVAIVYAISRIIVTLSISIYFRSVIDYKGKKEFEFKKLLNTSLPILGIIISGTIFANADAIFLGIFKDSKEVGLYTVAARIAVLTSFLLQVSNSAVSPKIAALFSNNKLEELEQMIQKITRNLLVVGFLTLLIFYFFGEIILSIWGDEFKNAFWILFILGVGQFINLATGPVGSLLIMSGYEKIQLKISLFFVTLNIILNIILIPFLGAIGAAIATAITIAGINLTRVIYVHFKIGINTI